MGLRHFEREEDDHVQGCWVVFGNAKHILLGLLAVIGIVCVLGNNEWDGEKKIKSQIWFEDKLNEILN